jgi:hypothetical protein
MRSAALSLSLALTFVHAGCGADVDLDYAALEECIEAGPSGSAVLAYGEFPGSVAIDEEYVYWGDPHGGTLNRVPKECGPNQVLAKGAEVPSKIALDDEYVYWLDYGKGITGGGWVYRSPKDGSDIDVLAFGLTGPWDLAIDGGYAYWPEFGSYNHHNDGRVARVSLEPGGEVEVLAEGQKQAAGIAAQDGRVVWSVNHESRAEVREWTGSGSVRVLRDSTRPLNVAFSGTDLIVGTYGSNAVGSGDSKILRVSESGQVQELAIGQENVRPLIVSEGDIIWATLSGGLHVMPEHGGPIETVLDPDGIAEIRGIAADENNIYFSYQPTPVQGSSNDMEIRRIPRP